MKLKNIILICLGAAIVIFLIWCNRPAGEVPEPPTVVPLQVQKDTVAKNEAATKRVVDSLNKLVRLWEKEADKYKGQYRNLSVLYDKVSKDYSQTLSELPQDNAKVIEAIQRFEELTKISVEKDEMCVREITALRTSLTLKDNIINEGELLNKKLKKSFDTCTSQQSKLEKYIQEAQKATKKRNQVYAGVSVMGNEFNWLNGMGINAGVINKRGGIFEAGAFVMSKQVNYSLSFKKVISFKRK